jgi:RimJ/RimL family protein N-acetyltransferase
MSKLFLGPTQSEDFVILTPRLRLRWPRHSDAENYSLYAGDIRIAEQTARIPHPYLLEEAQQYIADCRRQNAEGESLTLVMTARDDPHDAVVGSTTYRPSGGDAASTHELSNGSWVGVPFWSTGYCTEATRAVLDHVFSNIPAVDAVNVWIRSENTPSIRMVMRCGFRHFSTGSVDAPLRGCALDVVYLKVTRTNWLEDQEAARASLRDGRVGASV